ncbi:MAG TPA: mechanosensitive ion channel family protein [Fibrobacteria bacterium]|nr:mechanosensitive ion channel family protein [Fibrobacteria bacterium]
MIHDELMEHLKAAAPLGFVVAGWFIGMLLDSVLSARLRRWAAKTTWQGDDVIIDALAGLPKWICAIVGFHIALFDLPLSGGIATWVQKATLMTGVMVATVFCARMAVGFVGVYTQGMEGVAHSTSIFRSLAKVLVFVIGGLIALQSAGISIAPILTALGVGGLATALALQPTLANLFSGIQILASRTINPGDFVRLDSGEEGHVLDINWRTTTIRSATSSMVMIPNSKLATVVVTNHHYPDREIGVPLTVQVAYGSDLSRVEVAVREVGVEVQTQLSGGVTTHVPEARFSAFADNGIQVAIGLRATDPTEQGLLRHEFIKRLEERFRREGIEIPYPTREIRQRP